MTDHAARVVIAVTLLLAGVGGAVADGPPAELGAETFATSGVDADSVVLDVGLEADGTANWTVAYRVELTNDNETAAFESLREDIAANTSTYLSAFRDRMERTARTATNATGRSMAIEGLSVSTSQEGLQGYGVVEYRFSWTNFAVVEGERIRAGDALAGFFLEENSRLRMSWPEGYAAETVTPEPDEQRDRAVVWSGPVEFGSAGPQVTVGPEGGLPLLALGAVAVILLGVAVAGFVWYSREEPAGDGDGEPTPATDAESDTAQPDEELLSNEERVLRLLEERGGRVKQQDVAGEFEWTDAKTSQVVKTLREDDEIDVFRLGRENVLVLPDESEL